MPHDMPSKPPRRRPAFGLDAPDDAAEIAVGRAAERAGTTTSKPAAQGVDLTGRPKVLMAVGLGASGKTTLVRWLSETMLERGGEAVLAALDPENRALVQYFDDVQQPNSYAPEYVTKWLEDFLRWIMQQKTSAVIDFGGGDTTLSRLVSEVPSLDAMMEEAGVSLVPFYLLSPRIDDLTPLATLEAAGFQPRATGLVRNVGRADRMVPREVAFARTMKHSVYRSAVARGAVELWMPPLDPAKEIEDRRMGFRRAATASDGPFATRPFDRARVGKWLEAMASELSCVSSWIP